LINKFSEAKLLVDNIYQRDEMIILINELKIIYTNIDYVKCDKLTYHPLMKMLANLDVKLDYMNRYIVLMQRHVQGVIIPNEEQAIILSYLTGRKFISQKKYSEYIEKKKIEDEAMKKAKERGDQETIDKILIERNKPSSRRIEGDTVILYEKKVILTEEEKKGKEEEDKNTQPEDTTKVTPDNQPKLTMKKARTETNTTKEEERSKKHQTEENKNNEGNQNTRRKHR